MRILLTIEDISYGRGAERVSVNLANALSALGHEVSIMSFYQRHTGLPYTNINPSVKLIFKYNYEESMVQEKAKKKFLLGFYYKNIHKIILSYKMKKAKYDIIISSGFIYFPYFKNKNTHYIKIIHTNFQRYSSRNKYFDTLVVLSKKELPIWQSYHKNVKVIPNFLPNIPLKNTDYDKKIVLSVGAMSKEKGFLRLIKSWEILAHHQDFVKEFKEWKLVIVGDGELKSELENKIKKDKLKNVILKAFTKEIEKEYLNASIYAMSSYFEGFSMVLVEASSYGLAAVAFDVATGPKDIILDEKSGFLVPDNDLQIFANKLKALMSDKALRINFGKKAKQNVSEKFSQNAVLQLWQDLFSQIKTK